jgi:DNA-binding CsgD family transcriptional regulator
MDNEEKLDESIALLYEAAVNPALWRSSLTRFAEQVGAQAFHMFTWDRRAQHPLMAMVSHDHLFERIRLYDEYFHKVDPFLDRLLNRPLGQLLASQDLFDDRFVRRNEYFQDFLISSDFCWAAAGVIEVGTNVGATLALVRSHDNGRFSSEELERAKRLWHHFGRATALFVQTEQLRQKSVLGSHGLEEVEVGIAATDDHGRVVFVNEQAEAMINASGTIVLRSGFLSASDTDLSNRLKAAILNAASASACESFPVPAAPGRSEDLLLTVAPLRESAPAWTVLVRPSVLILIRSRARLRILGVGQLLQLFPLTPAEARLARALAHGQTPEEYASETGVSIATVRTQLRAVFDKTGTRRQTDLIRLLVSIPPSRK